MAITISNKSGKRKCSWCGKRPPKLYRGSAGGAILCYADFKTRHGYYPTTGSRSTR